MNKKIINWITLMVALLGTILTYADQWAPTLAAILPNAAHSGPVFIGGIVGLRALLLIILDWGDDGQINNSVKIILIFATLQFAGCETYQKTVASRSDSLEGFSKDGNYGGGYTHTVVYK